VLVDDLTVMHQLNLPHQGMLDGRFVERLRRPLVGGTERFIELPLPVGIELEPDVPILCVAAHFSRLPANDLAQSGPVEVPL